MLFLASTSLIAKKTTQFLFFELPKSLSQNFSFSEENSEKNEDLPSTPFEYHKTSKAANNAINMPTIILGADEEVNCANDGSTVARFNLCGNFDDRLISITGGTGEWQELVPTGTCTFDTSEDCPSSGTECNSSWQTVANATTFNLTASTINAATGAEYRVRTSGGIWNYFKVSKSTITQDVVKEDFVCGVPGRIQIIGLSSAYEYSIDGGIIWQGPTFDNLVPGTYNVLARLIGVPGACEYPYEPIVIEQREIAIEATFVDAICAGDTGSVTVNVNNTVNGPYKYTLLDSNGVAQEFTAFLPGDSYTFSAVGFGTYIVQVETQECSGDPANGIDPPRQSLDTSGNPIVIGSGLQALDASTEVNSSFGCADITSVDITLNVTGGSPPYTYTVNGAGGNPSFTGSTTHTVTLAEGPGSYDFVVTDSNLCTISASSNIEELDPPVITANGVDGTCTNGGARINFNITNSNGYNLSYRVNAADPWNSNPSISVPADPTGTTYTEISVRYQQDGFECTIDLPDVTVSSEGVISGSATKISDRTCDGAGGFIGGQIDFGPASGGSGSGYTFSVDGSNFVTTTSFTDLVPGTYTPIVRDDSGCQLGLTQITIEDTDPPTDIDFITSNSNCNTGTIDLLLIGTSNAAVVNYAIISPSTIDNGTNANFTALDASQSYIFQITDANNCTYTEAYTPRLISTIRARVKSGGNTQICNGAADGSGAFIVDGFENTYQYRINSDPLVTGQTSDEVAISGLAAGTYTITVTDETTGCSETASITVSEPTNPLTLSGNVTPMTCSNGNIGRVVAEPTGGWGTNTYTLVYPGGTTVGPKSGPTFSNLSLPGTYTLSATDVEGCTASFTFNLSTLSTPTITLDPSSDLCYSSASNATIVVTSTAGTAPVATHQYSLNGGTPQASGTFPNISPGNYTIEVEDGSGCTDIISVTIRPQLRVNTSIVSEILCSGTDGRIAVQASGGYLANATPKSYEVSSDNGATFAAPVAFVANTFFYDTNVPGDYIFRISDNEGCSAVSSPIYLAPPVNIDPATVIINPISCGNTSNGAVTIMPDGTSGIPPYEISFNGGPFTSQTVYSNLTAGSYSYVVRDSRQCVTVLENAVVGNDTTPTPDATISQIQASCSAGSIVAGSIQIDNVVDGVEDFSFIIEDAFGNPLTRVDDVARASLPITLNDPSLVPGNYTVVTLDANGCIDRDPISITTSDVIITPINFTPAVTCDDTAFTYTVQVTPTIFPTVPTYQIRIQGQPSFYPLDNSFGPDTHTFSNATDGIEYGVAYTVEVLDPNGCIYENEIPPVDGFSNLEISATTGGAFCDDDGNGQAEFTITDFTGPNLTIEFIEVATDNVIATDNPTGLTGGAGSSYTGTFNGPPGNYRILVTDSDGCTDAVNSTVTLNAPSVYVVSNIPANCNALGQITFVGTGGTPFPLPSSPYLYAVVPQGNPVDEDGTATPSLDDDFTVETTRVLPGSLAGTPYDIWVLDSRGCTFRVTRDVIQLQPDLPAPDFVVNNQCATASPSFDILVSVPATIDSPRFTLGGDEQQGVLNGSVYEYTYTVSTPGDYTVTVTDANGCTGSGVAEVFEFLFASGGFTTESTCNNTDGIITISAEGGSLNFDYELNGTDYSGATVGPITQSDDPVFTNMAPGSYTVLVTDRDVNDGTVNCDFLVDNINLERATQPILTPSIQNISCAGENDGSIDVIINSGTDVDGPFDYRLVDFNTRTLITNNNTGSFINLGYNANGYEVEVVSARDCIALTGRIDIIEPEPFEIGAQADPLSCASGANRFSSTDINVTVDPSSVGNVGTIGNYRYSITGFENYQTSPVFEIVDNGSSQNITVYAIDANGCQATANVTINPPTDVTPSLMVQSPLYCGIDETVRISVPASQTTSFRVTTVASIAIADITNTPGVPYVDIDLPQAGDYIFEVEDLIGGCIYPLPVHTVVAPSAPSVIISELESVSCDGLNDGSLFISVNDYSGLYRYEVYSGDDPNATTILASRDNVDTANNPETIPGLAGGNFFVRVISESTPFCDTDSEIATVRAPNGPVVVNAMPIGNVSCNNNTGVIEAIASGGWDANPYEYRLLQSNDGGSTYNEIVPFSNTSQFTGLSAGFYRVEVRDFELCPGFIDVELEVVLPISAGIREPLALQCPNGNNAILEAFDPTTGDENTATAGATGGVAGAGYNYRLLYLNSNLNTDIDFEGGWQNSPTFAGPSGGYISEGWYAIEVTSSFECRFVTEAIYVLPPDPIAPRLIQSRVSGCGGLGQLHLFIENHDPALNFEYEYRSIPTADPINDPWTDMGAGVSEVYFDLPGSPTGIFYQYEVRKKNATNVCEPVEVGRTLTDATGVFLDVNVPDDISCSDQTDGRIESFLEGGVGNNQVTLYIGDPIDAANPSPSATVFRGPQDHGTFEGLPEGSNYYIGVTSGGCSDIAGPFEIIRPEPIIYVDSITPVSCVDGINGTATIEVTSGGEGLIQFAIGPNFSEFVSDAATPGLYTFDELNAGSHEILILDESGCPERVTVTIPQPDPIVATIVNITPVTCIGFEDGTVQISIQGGTPFVDPITNVSYYETRLIGPDSDFNEPFTRNDALFFDNLIGGEMYFIEIRDEFGCPADIPVPVGIGAYLEARPIIDIGCDGMFPNNNVTIELEDSSISDDVFYALNPVDATDANTAMADTTRAWSNLSAGDHTVYLYHINGCMSMVEFTLESYEPLMLNVEKTGPNEVTATTTGGFGNYEFFFQGESTGTTNVFVSNQSTMVNVEVRDEGGCVAVASVPFEFTGMLEFPNFFTPDGDALNDMWGPRNADMFPNLEVKIYDRYGRQVAVLKQIEQWDGRYESDELPSGDYWYEVNANDENKTRYIGHFTLYR